MAKSIKFNLVLDNKPVRNLDDLRDNFNIEDLLAAYRNGSLKRWLETRDLTKEIAELEKISGDDFTVAMELCRILQGDFTKGQIEAAVYPFEFRQKEAEKLRQYKDLKEQQHEVIRAYHGGYEKLLKKIENKGSEYPFIKSALTEIYENYFGLFKLNINSFYKQFIFDFPLVILGVLANSELRPFFVSTEDIASRSKNFVFADNMENILFDITKPERARSSFLERYRSGIPQPHFRQCSTQEELEEIKEQFTNLLLLEGAASGATIKEVKTERISAIPFNYIAMDASSFPSYVSSFSGKTEGYWKDIEPNGRSFMLISMESSNCVRNTGKNGEELKAEDVNGKFLILDGIDYKSNNDSHQLVYMEV